MQKRSFRILTGSENRERRGSFFLPRETQELALERIDILGQLDDFDAALRRGGCSCKRCEDRRWLIDMMERRAAR